MYQDLHYNAVQDVAVNDTFFLYNPEVILKVTLPSTEDRIENLYIRRRYKEALTLINSTYSKPMLSKVQCSYFNQLLNLANLAKYLGS